MSAADTPGRKPAGPVGGSRPRPGKRAARTAKQDSIANVYDTEILPIWSQRFGQLLLRDLALPPKAMVLDVGCGTGYPALEVLRRMDGRAASSPSTPSSADARRGARQGGDAGGQAHLLPHRARDAALAFADDVYDLVVCNPGLDEFDDPPGHLREFARVAKPAGACVPRCRSPGTFDEFFDIYREVLVKHDRHEALDASTRTARAIPTPEQARRWLEDAGLGSRGVEVETFTLLFKLARVLLRARHRVRTRSPTGRTIAGKRPGDAGRLLVHQGGDRRLLRQAAFSVTVVAGCLAGVRGTASGAAAEVRRLPDEGDEIEVITGQVAIESVIPLDEPEEVGAEPLAARPPASHEPQKENG